MKKHIRLYVEGLAVTVSPVGEDLKAEKIRYNKNEVEKIEITVSIETLKEWQEKINKIIKRYDMEDRL